MLMLIILVPLAIDWLIIGNNMPSNITNSDWVGFLGSYIGSIVGAIVSLVGIIVTINFTKRQIQMQNHQYEEKKRLDNIPVLDFEVEQFIEDEDSESISMDVEYALDNKQEFKALTIEFNVYNMGIGAALDLKYAMQIEGEQQDGEFWLTQNRILKSQDSFVQKLTFFVPKKDYNFKPTLLVYYEDILGNMYCKSVDILIKLKDETSGSFVLIQNQNKGELCLKEERDKYFVFRSLKINDDK